MSYLIMTLIKMRLLISLVLSRYRLACKYGRVFQKSKDTQMQNLHFVIPLKAISNQVRLKQKLDSIYFFN